MAGSIQRVQGFERINFFGVRHLSPAASWHLLKLLDKVTPKCVLIEGPSDANQLIRDITGPEVIPPVAVLAYTSELPIATVLYPFVEYSPEYQAMRWAMDNGVEVEFIDLPCGVSLSLNRHKTTKDEVSESAGEYYEFTRRLYAQVVESESELNYNSYWERNFEHNLNEDAYNQTLMLHSDEMRSLTEPMEFQALPQSNAVDLIREAYMAARIEEKLLRYPPEEIVVITGAYHSLRLRSKTLPMSREEADSLPSRDARLTLMPYSFYRLSSRSGYGAGNSAPEYFNLMWSCMRQGRLSDLPVEYISKLGRFVRESGGYCSTASVIEAVRLSFALASIKGGSLPTLSDLHDACTACIGHGDTSEVVTAFAMVDIGTAFGYLPEGVSQTPIQDDMNRELKRLKLDRYKTTVAQQLDLDLRENTKVSSQKAAFIDLNRSTFLHRLEFLGICFAQKMRTNQSSATWRESWTLVWSPEAEIQVVESALRGETIELAAAFLLKERLEECDNVLTASKLISSAYICDLTDGIEDAATVLQAVVADSSSFIHNAGASFELGAIIQYAGLRKRDTQPLEPLLRQLFLRACLLLTDASSCDDTAADGLADAMGIMHTVSQENYELVDDGEWIKALRDLAARDDKNPKLSGLAFSILLERNLVDDGFCSREISRRLSPGIPADIGAGWFEGVSRRNHYALLSRIELWRELDGYINNLDDKEFKRSLVFLRRAFSSFEPREKNGITELLAEFWGVEATEAAMFLQDELNEEESQSLAELNDFDFDF